MAGTSSPVDLDVRDHLLVLVRRKWIVLGSVVLFASAAFLASYLQTPVYASSTKVLIQRPSSASMFDASNQKVINSDLLAEIELQFFNGDAVKKAAEAKLGYSAAAVATAGGRGSTMDIRATNTDPAKAADIANAFTQAYVDTRRQTTIDDYTQTAQATQAKIDQIDKQLKTIDDAAIEAGIAAEPAPTTTEKPKAGAAPPTTIGVTTTTSASGKAERESLSAQKEALEKSMSTLQIAQQNAQGGGPQIIVPAKPSGSPVSPNPRRDTMVGALVGLLIGVAAAFLFDFLDDSIKSRTDLEAATSSTPILAIIPHLSNWRNRGEAHLASIEQPSSPTAEAYRTLRTSVQFAGLERPIHALQVTSPRSQDGKTTTSANLAVALARAGLRVILVDCDLRRPRIHEFIGGSNAVGFTSVLLGDADLTSALQPVEGLRTLHLLPSGPTPPNPSELLSGRRAADLFNLLKEQADILVIDSPPTLPVSDALVISDLMDAVIMVVAAGSTTKKEAHRAFEMLTQVEAPIIGTVMNSGPGQSGYGYGYGYGYGNGYGYGDEKKTGLGRLLGSGSKSKKETVAAD